MPRKPRSEVIDLDVTDLYHIDSRCVRRAFLFAVGDDHRKRHLENRARFLQLVFAIDVLFVSFMDNHFHLVLRVCRDEALSWSAQEVAWRWASLHPPRNEGKHYVRDDQVEGYVQAWAADPQWVEEHRRKLYDISQFMKDAKQAVAAEANREEGVTGHFFQGRFDCNPIENEAALLAVGAYVDLNPFAAGLCDYPEQGPFTSLRQRVESRDLVLARLREAAAADPDQAPPEVQRWLEREVWVAPIDMPPDGEPLPERSVDAVLDAEARATTDHPGGNDDVPPSSLSCHINRIKGWPVRISRSVRPAFLTMRMTLDAYLKFVDYAARLLRDGKAKLDEAARPILERLDATADGFADLLLGLQAKATARGTCLEVS